MSGDFNPEQKRYLEGFVAGMQIAKTARAVGGAPGTQGAIAGEPTGPDAGKLLQPYLPTTVPTNGPENKP